jgi:hypothetical protein
MEEQVEGVAFPSTQTGAAEERMLHEDLVREIGARRKRGESTRRIAGELDRVREGVEAKLCVGPDGPETFVLCR